jgi:hypothetical protein
MTPELEEDIQKGRDAALVEATVLPYIHGQMENKLTMLISMYRSRDLDGDTAVNMIAEMSALRGLIEELENRQRRGYIATQREYEYGTQEDDSSVVED